MAVIACPYKISQSPSSSKIECNYEQSKFARKLYSIPIGNHLERDGKTFQHQRKKKIIDSSLFSRTLTLSSTSTSSSPPTTSNQIYPYPVSKTNILNNTHSLHTEPLYAALNSPRGFGPPPKKTKKPKPSKKDDDDDNNDDNDNDDEEGEGVSEGGVIPEIVTNRMIKRMGFTVGVPLAIGVMFFPFFYYLKVGLKIDVPTWVAVIVSFVFYGGALLGVSYGIVSSSWDPMREGSLLGWNEAQKNWPVFWQSIRGKSGGNK